MKKQKNAPQILPREEWPYEVPENWVWTRLEKISNVIMGQSPSGNDTTDDSSFTPLIGGASDLGEIYPSITKYTKIITKEAKINDVILCIRATLGHPVFADKIYCLGRGVAAIRSPLCSKELLKYFFINFEQYLYEHATGTTFAQITGKVLNSMPFPLPPLPEQQRIVARINSLFAKLDAAAEKIRAALDTFPTRKAALLHKAFTGELTKKWREEHGVGMDSWKINSVEDLCSLIVDCPHSTPTWTKQGKLCLRTTNIKDGYLDFTKKQYVSEETFNERNKRAIPRSGDVLLTREGSIGDVGVIPPNVEICLGQRMMLLRPRNCDPKFLVYFFRNPYTMETITAHTMGSTAPRMNIKALKQLSLNCPALDEQKHIVKILHSSFIKEQTAKETAERLLDTIALTKKSILARAFRGLLDTNAPKEESAEDLLKYSYHKEVS